MTQDDGSRIEELNEQGYSVQEIADATGNKYHAIYAYLRRHGLLLNYSKGKQYRVYNRATGGLIAEGSAAECAYMLGYPGVASFYSTIVRARKGTLRKYRICEVEK